MIDTSDKNKNKSLSADTELHSAYEYLRKGDYKLCKRTIDKKMPKLKSALDKVNFNILKILLFNKMKKLKEAKKLVESVKNEVLESPVLNSNSDLISYFKNVLRELGEEQAASDIFKSSVKNLDLSKISRGEQLKIMKELTLNYEFQDLNAKVNAFLKNKNDPDIKFLTLMKYEALYILAFKYEKLSKNMVNLTLKEMLNNYNNKNFSQEKGFIDILVKYLLALGDHDTFLQLFEDKKIEFTNAPMEDLIVEIYFKKDDPVKLSNYLLNSIRSKLVEWNYISYQRLINYIFHWIDKVGKLTNKLDLSMIMGYDKILEGMSDSNSAVNFYETFKFESHNFSSEPDANFLISSLLLFFEIIQTQMADKKTNFNGYKSALLSRLLIFHNLILISNDNKATYENLNKEIFSLLVEILENSVNKQSILIEIKSYFTYLNLDQRNEILSKFSFKFESSTDENDFEKTIFYHKLEKMLKISPADVAYAYSKIQILEQIYFKVTSNNGKLEKGERLLGDDLIILINEYFFELVGLNYNSINEDINKLAFILYSLNSVAHERSPFNYDITLFYLKIASFMNMPSKVLEILKFMNLKGPQFETVSYIAFPCFLSNFFRPGLTYLIESFDNWDSSNKKSIRKTFWKMFTGRNFWNTEELFGFLGENEVSYYKQILDFLDLLLSFNDNLTFSYEDEEIRKENFSDFLELFISNYSKFEKLIEGLKLSLNQDMIISLFKFKKVDYFDYNFDVLKVNKNYKDTNYKYKIDALMKENCLYESYPGYKNNFLIQNDTQVFNFYDNHNLLSIHYLNKIVFSSLFQLGPKNFSSDSVLLQMLEKYQVTLKNIKTENNSDLFIQYENIQSTLLNVYLECEKSLDDLKKIETNTQVIEDPYSQLTNDFIDKSSGLRKSLSPVDFFSGFNYFRHFQFFKNFYLPNFTFLTSKFVDLVNLNKKNLTDAGALKMKLMNNFKTPMMNFLIENGNVCNEIIKTLSNSGGEEINDYLLKVISQFDDAMLSQISKEQILEISKKFVDELKESLKVVMESSKVYKNFVKDNI